ncbi:MAG TPA: 1,2-phenylacetyl-CoA epoxidase subunit PaaE [Trebonia sp.]|nr:1,2-phenylacetyl-CoA epoxidase subunit PaaE [Trebonia sp.]
MTETQDREPASVLRRSFHQLKVRRVEPLTEDSAAITLTVPSDLVGLFAFAAGQTLTVRLGEERRTYSICAPVGAAPRIGVREVAGGAVSGWLVRSLKAGDTLEVQAPSGTFTPDLSVPGHHVLIAAGSGITPMMSIAASILAADDKSSVTLLYGNRRSDTVMFADEVADLKDAHPARMRIVHVLSREPQEVELFSGRLDAARLAELLPVTVDVAGVDHWWLCGPFGMVTDAIEVLRALGVDSTRIHRELFWVGDDPPVVATHEDAPVGDGASLTVMLDGRSSSLTLPPGTPILDGAQRARPDLPFACKGGVCGTCRAKVVSGAAVMRRNYALEPHEVEAGYVLTCQALPQTDEIIVDYDA